MASGASSYFIGLKSIIQEGNFDLTSMVNRINYFVMQGLIQTDEAEDLLSAARAKAAEQGAYGNYQEQINTLAGAIRDLNMRFEALVNELGVDVSVPATSDAAEFVQPTGAHDAYYEGDLVLFEGQTYRCIAPEGVACVWSPSVYPDYWEKVVS